MWSVTLSGVPQVMVVIITVVALSVWHVMMSGWPVTVAAINLEGSTI